MAYFSRSQVSHTGKAWAVFDDVPENPTIDGVERALSCLKSEACDGVVAVGGRSVLDLESTTCCGCAGWRRHRLSQDPEKIGVNVAPYITIPTTAGTGAEITFGVAFIPKKIARPWASAIPRKT